MAWTYSSSSSQPYQAHLGPDRPTGSSPFRTASFFKRKLWNHPLVSVFPGSSLWSMRPASLPMPNMWNLSAPLQSPSTTYATRWSIGSFRPGAFIFAQLCSTSRLQIDMDRTTLSTVSILSSRSWAPTIPCGFVEVINMSIFLILSHLFCPYVLRLTCTGATIDNPDIPWIVSKIVLLSCCPSFCS